MAKILVTGGSGYIGSHTIVSLLESGHEVVSIDNFLNSYPAALEGIYRITGKKIKNFNIDLTDFLAVEKVFRSCQDIDGIIHFAALKAVGESVEKPILYYRNNILSLLNVVEAALGTGVNKIIFSSSCTVYGQPDQLPVTEATPLKEPASPYGRTKRIGEDLLHEVASLRDCHIVSLRYFNPAGAHPSGLIGESSRVEALNLVPVITETASGKRTQLFVHGNDYPTRDGTCIRDYIDILDLARAHVLALQYLIAQKNKERFEVFNIGSGNGTSVMEAIEAFKKATGKNLNVKIGPRRPGDVAAIYSDYGIAEKYLGWTPQRDIRAMMETAWQWEQIRTY